MLEHPSVDNEVCLHVLLELKVSLLNVVIPEAIIIVKEVYGQVCAIVRRLVIEIERIFNWEIC